MNTNTRILSLVLIVSTMLALKLAPVNAQLADNSHGHSLLSSPVSSGGPTARPACTEGSDNPLTPCVAPSLPTPPDNPCELVNLFGAGCPDARDPMRSELLAMGKPGRVIERAREKALEILQVENPCSAWYRESRPYPAATFRSIAYALDDAGPQFIARWQDDSQAWLFRQPYVAHVVQNSGAHALVTLNTSGAFFQVDSPVRELQKDGGPMRVRDREVLRVDSYAGGTLPAQVITLLHEFAHAVGLIPPDLADAGGKSVRNTQELLRFCRGEVEAASKHTPSSGT
jgi:hypothetical protein